MNSTPQTIGEYLDQLRAALAGADPAMIQDALYDAEEHLRSELADNPGLSEAELLAKISSSYGAPEEVAEIYRNQEVTVTRALRPPPRREPSSNPITRFFAVAGDPHAYAAMFYLLLSLATGIFYFTWAIAGIAMSMAFALSLVGIPFLILFFGSVRMLSLLEGRIVEGMLGVRMPRRPPYADRDLPLGKRIVAMFTDPRSWSSLFYMLVMLPLGLDLADRVRRRFSRLVRDAARRTRHRPHARRGCKKPVGEDCGVSVQTNTAMPSRTNPLTASNRCRYINQRGNNCPRC